MYIEFSFEDSQSLIIIRKELINWSQKYAIKCSEKLIKRTYRVTFDNDTTYSLFAMTWNPDKKYHALGRWRIVSDLNNKTSFDSVL
jgi:hypothetical protein